MIVENKSFIPEGSQTEVDLSSANVTLASQFTRPGVHVFALMASGGDAPYRFDGGDPTSSTNFVLKENTVIFVKAGEDYNMVFKATAGVTLVLQPGKLQ